MMYGQAMRGMAPSDIYIGSNKFIKNIKTANQDLQMPNTRLLELRLTGVSRLILTMKN